MRESILNSLRDILITRSPLEDLPESVWKRTSALNTWGTNAIEGNTLTWHEVKQLLLEERSVGGRPVKDILETLQHERVFRDLIRRRSHPIDLGTILELHESVFKGVKTDTGRWRRVNVRISGSKHAPPRMERVIDETEKMLHEYEKRDIEGEDTIALGAWLHHRFESIHPFSDGNGRVGRLLLNLHLMKHSWPPVHILPPDRARYLSSMETGHSGDLSDLTVFIEELMARALLDLLDQIGTALDELRPLKEFEEQGPYSAQYLRLRAGQGELPAVKRSGDWHSSERALQLYRSTI
ncbi:MAG: Fic family protein [Thermoplasmatota archaeon]